MTGDLETGSGDVDISPDRALAVYGTLAPGKIADLTTRMAKSSRARARKGFLCDRRSV